MACTNVSESLSRVCISRPWTTTCLVFALMPKHMLPTTYNYSAVPILNQVVQADLSSESERKAVKKILRPWSSNAPSGARRFPSFRRTSLLVTCSFCGVAFSLASSRDLDAQVTTLWNIRLCGWQKRQWWRTATTMSTAF